MTHQLVKKVILSVDMFAIFQVKLHLSVRPHNGKGASRSSSVLSLELSRSSLNGMISEQGIGNLSSTEEGLPTTLNTRHASFRF